jgi:hypothetical protein
LSRHGVANLRELQAKALADAGESKPPLKTFKDYEPGFLHMDIPSSTLPRPKPAAAPNESIAWP